MSVRVYVVHNSVCMTAALPLL